MIDETQYNASKSEYDRLIKKRLQIRDDWLSLQQEIEMHINIMTDYQRQIKNEKNINSI